MFEVKLIPHVGLQETHVGVFEIELDQFQVLLNDRVVGYVGKYPGARVSLIVQNLPRQVANKIKEDVDRQLGKESPPIVLASVIEEEEGEDGSEEQS